MSEINQFLTKMELNEFLKIRKKEIRENLEEIQKFNSNGKSIPDRVYVEQLEDIERLLKENKDAQHS